MSEIKITDNSKEVLTSLQKKKLQALHGIGMKAADHAAKNTPVDTSLLRNSITYAISGQPAAKSSYSSKDGSVHGEYSGAAPSDDSLSVYIGSNVEYAVYVELGTAQRDPVHMLKKAATEHSEEYKAIAKAALEK